MMSSWLWFGVLIVAVVAIHWGSERLAKPLEKLRRQWGITAAAGGAVVALATASPELGVNITSAVRGVSGIGLGQALGSNVIAIPLTVTVGYLATRRRRLGDKENGESDSEAVDEAEKPAEHEQHVEQNLLRVQKEATTVLALPYLAVLALVALLTLPPGWRGLQPVDALILLAAFVLFLAQAVYRGREQSEDEEWQRQEVLLAVGGIVVIGLGAYFTVQATENIVSALGISQIVGGLYITAVMSALPEIFGTWNVARSGQVTSAVTSVVADHAYTLTLAFVPLALVSAPVENFQLYWVNLVFVTLMPVLYAGFIHFGSDEHGLSLWQVLALDGVYLLYLGVTLFGVLNIFS